MQILNVQMKKLFGPGGKIKAQNVQHRTVCCEILSASVSRDRKLLYNGKR